MSDSNIFEAAVKHSETDMFFKGQGKYFVRDLDWGEHVYAAHYGSWVDRFVNESISNEKKFSKCFSSFIESLILNEESLDHLFGNLNAIAYWKGKGKLQSLPVFEKGSLENKSLEMFLVKLNESKLKTDKYELIMQYVGGVEDEGFKLPVNLK